MNTSLDQLFWTYGHTINRSFIPAIRRQELNRVFKLLEQKFGEQLYSAIKTYNRPILSMQDYTEIHALIVAEQRKSLALRGYGTTPHGISEEVFEDNTDDDTYITMHVQVTTTTTYRVEVLKRALEEICDDNYRSVDLQYADVRSEVSEDYDIWFDESIDQEAFDTVRDYRGYFAGQVVSYYNEN